MATTETLPNGGNSALIAATDATIASSVARVQAETQAAIMVAQRFKRNESQCRQDLLDAVKASTRLAEKATYRYPRGKKQDPVTQEWSENIVQGPSTYIAREAARVWGNVLCGTEIIRETDDERQIRSYAWDMQTNAKWFADAAFRKLVQRSEWKTVNGKREKVSRWIVPDEREMRELNNKYASIGERNCLLKVIPTHLIDEVLETAKMTTTENAFKHPEAVRARMVDLFMTVGVTVAMLEEYCGRPLKELPPDKLVELKAVYQALAEGAATWDDYRNSTTLPTVEEVPELPKLKELAKKLKWNDARLSNEIGRNKDSIGKLVAAMTEQVAKMPPAQTSNAAPTPASEAAVGLDKAKTSGQVTPAAEPPKQQQQQRRPQQRSDVKDF